MQNSCLRRKPGLFYSALLIITLHSHALFAAQQTYSVGVVPQHDARHVFDSWHPILEYLSQLCGVQSTFDIQPETVRKHLKVIYRTQPLTPHPVIVHPRIPKPHIKKVINAFYNWSRALKVRECLSKYR